MNFGKIMLEIMVLMLYILIGYIAKRKKIVSDQGVQDISKLVVNIAMPAMVINAMIIEYTDEHARNMLVLTVMSFVFFFFVCLAGAKLSRLFPGKTAERSAINYCMIFGNAIFLGYPLANALFGQVGMLYASVFVAVQNLFQWTVGVNIFKRERIQLSNLKKLLNPGIIAIVIGLVLFVSGIHIPELLNKVLKGVGGLSVPLALMIIGATLQGMRLSEVLGDKRITAVSIIKTIVFPVVFLGVMYFLPFDNMIKSIITIQAAAPVQASAAAFARNFNGDVEIPAKTVFISTLICLFTIPLFLVLVHR